jgi:CoA:oxalate CoA-transferase
MKPLEGLLVLDFSIFLAGPLAALRLGDLGARVIKIERPDVGDLCRQLYISNLQLDGDSTLFHSINRNKESFTANFKDAADLSRVRKLIAKADVMIGNFRPGVLKKLGLDYESVRAINPRLVDDHRLRQRRSVGGQAGTRLACAVARRRGVVER